VYHQTVVGSNQPIVIFTQQPQQPYFSVPQVDPVITSSIPGEQMCMFSETESSEHVANNIGCEILSMDIMVILCSVGAHIYMESIDYYQ